MNLVKVLFILLFAAACSPANASEPAQRRAEFLDKEYNRVKDNPVRVRSVKPETTTTVGYIGTRHVRMRSSTKGKTTISRGYVNGRYVILKTRKD